MLTLDNGCNCWNISFHEKKKEKTIIACNVGSVC